MACIMKFFFLFHFFRSRVTTPYIYIFRGSLFFLPKSKIFSKKTKSFFFCCEWIFLRKGREKWMVIRGIIKIESKVLFDWKKNGGPRSRLLAASQNGTKFGVSICHLGLRPINCFWKTLFFFYEIRREIEWVSFIERILAAMKII